MTDIASALVRSGDRRMWTVGQLLGVDTAANRLLVSVDGSPSVALPFVPGAYDGITTVFVLRDPDGSGAGQMVLGPCYSMPEPPPPPPPQDDPAQPPALVTQTVTVRPTWSGTWRVVRSAWDRWNTDRYGGRSTLYQGSAYGSGDLIGLAVYGEQLVSLGATEITRVVVSTPLATGSGDATVQGSPHGSKPSGAPTVSGATASGASAVELDASVREAMRTGSVKGLATVGASYRGTYGTSKANGMSLAVTYTRPA